MESVSAASTLVVVALSFVGLETVENRGVRKEAGMCLVRAQQQIKPLFPALALAPVPDSWC